MVNSHILSDDKVRQPTHPLNTHMHPLTHPLDTLTHHLTHHLTHPSTHPHDLPRPTTVPILLIYLIITPFRYSHTHSDAISTYTLLIYLSRPITVQIERNKRAKKRLMGSGIVTAYLTYTLSVQHTAVNTHTPRQYSHRQYNIHISIHTHRQYKYPH